MKILVIEDEQIAAEVIRLICEKEGMTCDLAMTGQEGLNMAISQQYDVVLVDLMLPDMFGIDLIRQVRATGINTPMIITSALADDANVREGKSAGANDYLIKPFDPDTLVSRVYACSMHVEEQEGALLSDDLLLDATTKYVTYQNKKCKLSAKQFDIANLLLENRGKFVTKSRILSCLQSSQHTESADNDEIKAQIDTMGKKIAAITGNKQTIQNQSNSAYMIA